MNEKQESERLMNELLPLAERMLKTHGEFYPYGGCMKPDGTIVEVGVESPNATHPKSAALISMLRDTFRKKARDHECRVVAVVFDVTVTLPNSNRKSSAIQFCIDHIGGYSAEVFFPYVISGDDIVYGETFAQEGGHTVFGLN